MFFTLVLSSFVSIALYNRSRVAPLEESSKLSSKEAVNNSTVASVSKKEKVRLPILQSEHAGKLYAILYSDRFNNHLSPLDIEEISQRFERNYTEHKENQSRLSILKALSRANVDDINVLKLLKNLYLTIAGNETEIWNVRTQSIRNLKLMRNIGDREERMKLLAKLDKRFLHLAQYSDDELLNQVIQNEKK